MQNNKTTSMVEAGILAAVAVLFAVAGIYLPVAGAFINVVWPVPMILLGVRHGLKWSSLCLVTAGVLVAILVNPVQSLLLVAGMGFIGLTVGWAMKRGFSPLKTLFWGSVASFFSKMAVLVITFMVVGVNPLYVSPEKMAAAIEQMMKIMANLGITGQIAEEQRVVMTGMLSMLEIVLPSGFVAGAVFDTFINFMAARAVLQRLGTYTEGLPLFREWVMPQPVLLIYGLSMILFSFYQSQIDSSGFKTVMNIQILASMPIILQGFAVFWFFVYRYRLPGFFRGVSVAAFFSLPIVPWAVILLGLLDFVMDFRKLRPARDSRV